MKQYKNEIREIIKRIRNEGSNPKIKKKYLTEVFLFFANFIILKRL